ncbi:LysR family transcriptional regulator [Candidatus Solirubrobacter pratensis]|uniref:LysR family transcriptional regulator n=1 Tax=Candidatus Solirubrobacter pratensis TaxID=1298857 RepID=UPI0004065449|nr:LysR substrate-binding domain-containing protein [Candidatus Solirubrobacter pratensis]
MGCDIDLRLLRYFVAVAEELHFGHAAMRLHLSQPALSTQIHKLEQLVGAQLLERTSRHVELTPAGAVLLEEARRVLVSAERALQATREAARGERGRFLVGFVANAAAELTPSILEAFETLHPQVHVEMRQFGFADPSCGLADGKVDVAFVRPPLPASEWLASEPLFIEPRVLVVADRFPVAARSEVVTEMLVDEPFVARRAPGYWRDYWLAVDQRDGHPVNVGAEATTVDECFEAIMRGQGMAFTQASSRRFYARPGLAFVPVADIPPASVSVAWRRDACTPFVAEFVAIALRLARVPGCVPESSLSTPVVVPELAVKRATGTPSGQIQPFRGTGGRARRRS